jgi:CheY-like chemotaxis protein
MGSASCTFRAEPTREDAKSKDGADLPARKCSTLIEAASTEQTASRTDKNSERSLATVKSQGRISSPSLAREPIVMCSDPVLFVDDDLISRLLNCAVLRESGFDVIEASSYAEACAAIERSPRLAALVTDIELGVGPDGFEIARRARLANPEVAVVYMSGTELRRYAREGVDNSRFIPKPFGPDQVVKALDDATPPTPASA